MKNVLYEKVMGPEDALSLRIRNTRNNLLTQENMAAVNDVFNKDITRGKGLVVQIINAQGRKEQRTIGGANTKETVQSISAELDKILKDHGFEDQKERASKIRVFIAAFPQKGQIGDVVEHMVGEIKKAVYGYQNDGDRESILIINSKDNTVKFQQIADFSVKNLVDIDVPLEEACKSNIVLDLTNVKKLEDYVPQKITMQAFNAAATIALLSEHKTLSPTEKNLLITSAISEFNRNFQSMENTENNIGDQSKHLVYDRFFNTLLSQDLVKGRDGLSGDSVVAQCTSLQSKKMLAQELISELHHDLVKSGVDSLHAKIQDKLQEIVLQDNKKFFPNGVADHMKIKDQDGQETGKEYPIEQPTLSKDDVQMFSQELKNIFAPLYADDPKKKDVFDKYAEKIMANCVRKCALNQTVGAFFEDVMNSIKEFFKDIVVSLGVDAQEYKEYREVKEEISKSFVEKFAKERDGSGGGRKY